MITYISKISWKDKAHFACQFTILFAIRAVVMLLGFIVVPVALLFRKENVLKSMVIDSAKRPFIELPKWAWLWSNDEEGMASFYAPWWEAHDGKADTYWAMLKWGCIRNPANNMRFTKMFQLDMMKCDHEVCDMGLNFYAKSTDRETGKVFYTFRRRKFFDYKGQRISYIIHLGFKALRATLSDFENNPTLFNHAHYRYRGFAFQIIPRKGLKK